MLTSHTFTPQTKNSFSFQMCFLSRYSFNCILISSTCFMSLFLVPPQLQHRAATLTQDEMRVALSHTDLEQMWQRDLRPLLVTRYPGSAGSQAVQDVSILHNFISLPVPQKNLVLHNTHIFL